MSEGDRGPDGRRWRVVLVDDAEGLRSLVARLLARDGRFEVVGEASDGQEGIEVVTATEPDAVVLDLAMPVMDGLEALPRIRAAAPGAKIVILTGFDEASLSGDDVYVNADGFVEKGVAFEHLCDTLARACDADARGV